MMHYIAILLFEAGRFQTLLYLILALHLFLFWHWRNHPTLRDWSVGWLLCFVLPSILVFLVSGLLERIEDGVGYNIAHLYGGMWSDQEAITNLLLTWHNILLPIYLPWLAIWLIGLATVIVLAKQITPVTSQKAIAMMTNITMTLLTVLILIFGWLLGH